MVPDSGRRSEGDHSTPRILYVRARRNALKKSGVRWNEETLGVWLTDTEKLVPKNDMTFHVEKADERAAIIAYLKQMSIQ